MALNKFVEMFEEYSAHTNLMSKNDVTLLREKHISDSLSLGLFLKKYGFLEKSVRLLDMGTGGGLPAVPISVEYRDIEVFAVDSTKKKIDFVEKVKAELELTNLHPINSRLEELPENFKNSFDVVTTRALSELRVILEYAAPYLRVGGYFVAFKSRLVDSELENAKNALKTLNITFIEKIEYELPRKELSEQDFKRSLLIFKKTKPTPKAYPRNNGQIKKSPL